MVRKKNRQSKKERPCERGKEKKKLQKPPTLTSLFLKGPSRLSGWSDACLATLDACFLTHKVTHM